MKLLQAELKNFRCFNHQTISFERPLVIIEGDNGSGKTSLLEAIHYCCYLRSFRTHNTRTLIKHEQSSFFIKLEVEEELDFIATRHDVQVGLSGKRRSVKLNNRPICSYKELMDSYRVITVTEDDLALICDGPDERRSFIDQALVLKKPLFAKKLSELRRTVEQRSALIARGNTNKDIYRLWTEQLWTKSLEIQEERAAFLDVLLDRATGLISQMFNNAYHVTIQYANRLNIGQSSFDDWFEAYPTLYENERRMGRSLFGAHLDDFVIGFQQAHSKHYASRGQQKLLVLLIKIAQVQDITQNRGPVILLLDDFMTDFDKKKAEICLQALTDLQGQIILTSPQTSSCLSSMIEYLHGQKISLTL